MIDLTTGVSLSSLQIEQIVCSQPPRFIKNINHAVEQAVSFPNMMNTLWAYICTFRLFPTQTEFLEHYMRVHDSVIRNFDQTGVMARVLRSYPSLAREIHFYSLAKESNIFSSVYYSAYHDVELGVDIQVGLGRHIYNVSCFILTKRAVQFRKSKQLHRHAPQSNAIDNTLDLKTGKHINGWIFFDQTHVNKLFNKILNYAWIQHGQHPLDLLG